MKGVISIVCKRFVLLYFFVVALVCSACGSSNPEFIEGFQEINGELEDGTRSEFDLCDETSLDDSPTEESFFEKNDSEEAINDFQKACETVPVYVCGAVNAPGVYYLPAGAIKADALQAAGGFSADAIEDAVNLAEGLSEGEKIYFPHEGEEISESACNNVSDKDNLQSSSGKININVASKEELLTLPGIGDSKARDIIDYRNTNGPFKETSDIMNIVGIKDGVYNKIKDSIEVR